ncbi:MAG: patatin-like phospholipase family protein [Candidatus Aminicenantes bacterium]|nr:patatin-like phospholipase family protein [Candidatus Aminicenantes bacterium]
MKHSNIGLVLGSGAARGFAMLPILSRFKEENIHFSAVSGASIGSIIGSYYALYGETDSLFEKVKGKNAGDYLKMVDPNLPHKSLIKGKSIKKFLTSLFLEDKTFNDTRIPLTICAVDFRAKKPVYINEGKLIDAVMASISIPGIFAPYPYLSSTFIDGGALDPVPVRPLLEKKYKKIIGINLMGAKHPHKHASRDLFPTLLSTFYMMMEQLAVRESDKRLYMIDLNFEPDPINILSFFHWQDYYKVGEAWVRKDFDKALSWLNS